MSAFDTKQIFKLSLQTNCKKLWFFNVDLNRVDFIR